MLQRVFNKIRIPAWTFPVVLALVAFSTFGLLAPRLGFYWDDWPPQLVQRLFGTSAFWNYYSTDRPFSAWTYVLLSPLLGNSPLPWHIFSLCMRGCAALGVWWSMLALFPKFRRQAAWVALLFVIYPAFTQQSLAVTYNQAWIGLSCYFISIAAMLQALRSKRARWAFHLLAIAAWIGNFSISEYFIGLEALRPLFLWFFNRELDPKLSKRVWFTLKTWLPYLLLTVLYVCWRLFFIQFPADDPNRPTLLYNLFSKPGEVLPHLSTMVLQDFTYLLFSNWYRVLEPQLFANAEPLVTATWGLVLLLAAGVAVYFIRYEPDDETNAATPRNWVTAAFVIGVAGILLGPLPAWFIDRQVISGFNADRYAIAALFGASLVITGFLEWLTPRRIEKCIVFGLIVALAAGALLREANDYRWRWAKQSRFYWQLAWRAPSLAPQTALFFEKDPFPEQSLFSTSTALNLLYPQPQKPDVLAYWIYTISPRYNENNIGQLINGSAIKTDFRMFHFKGTVPNTLLAYYDPKVTPCLWILSPLDKGDPDLPPLARTAISISNLDRISAEEPPSGYPPADLFGKEPAHTWCYFYQKADLARQQGDWESVAALGDEAQQMGFSAMKSGANVAHEWLPFIEGYASTNREVDAQQISTAIYEYSPRYQPVLCDLWKRVSTRTNTPEAASILTEMKCP